MRANKAVTPYYLLSRRGHALCELKQNCVTFNQTNHVSSVTTARPKGCVPKNGLKEHSCDF